MENKVIKIIQLPAEDAYRLLALVHSSSCVCNDYWDELARRIFLDLQAQDDGKFFQCAACTSPQGEK